MYFAFIHLNFSHFVRLQIPYHHLTNFLRKVIFMCGQRVFFGTVTDRVHGKYEQSHQLQ